MHQGTGLGPLLFLINDLPDCVHSSKRLFADDCILYRQIRTQQDCAILQDDLNNLAAWEQKWGMAFHPDKCSTIRISRSRKPITMDYLSLVTRKPVSGVCNQVKLKPACTATEASRGLKFQMWKLEVLYYLGSENKGADQTVWMCRLICAFVVHIWHQQVFSTWLIYWKAAS